MKDIRIADAMRLLLFTVRDAHWLRIPYEKVTAFWFPVLAGRRLLMDWKRYCEALGPEQ